MFRSVILICVFALWANRPAAAGNEPARQLDQAQRSAVAAIDTQADERRNRRVVVRVITPLMKTGK